MELGWCFHLEEFLPATWERISKKCSEFKYVLRDVDDGCCFFFCGGGGMSPKWRVKNMGVKSLDFLVDGVLYPKTGSLLLQSLFSSDAWSGYRVLDDNKHVHPLKINGWNTKMKVWFRWFSFANRWFSGFMWYFPGCIQTKSRHFVDFYAMKDGQLFMWERSWIVLDKLSRHDLNETSAVYLDSSQINLILASWTAVQLHLHASPKMTQGTGIPEDPLTFQSFIWDPVSPLLSLLKQPSARPCGASS